MIQTDKRPISQLRRWNF